MGLQILELFKFKHRWLWCLHTNILRKSIPRTIWCEKFYVTKLTSRIEPKSQITHSDTPPRRWFFEGDWRKTVIFHKIQAVGYLHGGQMCAHSYYIRLVEHSTRNWGSSPLQIFVQGGRQMGISVECSILRGTPPAFYTPCILSELGNALNSCQFNSRFISFIVITSIATHCMPAPHTVCYSGKQVGLHHQPLCIEWTAAHLPYYMSYTRTACRTSRPDTVVTVTHWPAAATGDATLPRDSRAS